MKTLEEIKNDVAKSLGFDPDYDAELMIDECMQEYAKQCCDEHIKACAANSFLMDDPKTQFKHFKREIIDMETLLNTPNVVTTK